MDDHSDKPPVRQFLNSRMDSALKDAAERADDFEDEHGVSLPPSLVGEMALTMFQTRMSLAMSDTSGIDFSDPEDYERTFQ